MSVLQSVRERRLGVADLLDGAWEIVARRPWVYLLLGVVSESLQPFYGSDSARRQPDELLGQMGLTLLAMILCSWTSLAIIRLAAREVEGERASLEAALLGALGDLVPAVLTGLLAFVLLFLTMMFLGVLAAIPVAIAFSTHESAAAAARAVAPALAIALVPVLAFALYWSFYPQALALRGRRGWGALSASRALVRGRFWRVALAWLVLLVPLVLVAALLMLLPHTWQVRALCAIPSAAIMPFITVAGTLLFLNLDAVRPDRVPLRTQAAPDLVSTPAPGGPMKILVLGGGAQGRVIADDIAIRLPAASVTVADIRDPRLPARPNLAWREADCSSFDTVVRLMGEHDLAVGALPSRYGFAAMKAAIAARRNLVDVSFCAEDVLPLDAEARATGVTIVPDAGLAPGISNLLAGEAYARRGAPLELMIMVGGVAQDPSKPYGYCVTWSLDDLTEEYVRPARIVRGGEQVAVPVFSGMERVEVEGVGTMEAFYSDGLRSLMDTLPGVPEMGEKTLRWPGHAEAVQPLVAAGRLAEELRARCTLVPPEDLVALVVRLRWADGEELTTLVDRYDPASGLTAMSRTTALTTAVVAQMLAGGLVPPPGVQTLERVASDPRAFRAILDGIAAHGVKIDRGAI